MTQVSNNTDRYAKKQEIQAPRVLTTSEEMTICFAYYVPVGFNWIMAKPNESTRNAILNNIKWQTTKVRKTEILHAIIHTLGKLMFSNTTKTF